MDLVCINVAFSRQRQAAAPRRDGERDVAVAAVVYVGAHLQRPQEAVELTRGDLDDATLFPSLRIMSVELLLLLLLQQQLLYRVSCKLGPPPSPIAHYHQKVTSTHYMP